MEYLHDMSREELIKIIGRQEQEMIILEAVKNQYMKHLEKVIEYHSVEAYRNLVQKIEKELKSPLYIITPINRDVRLACNSNNRRHLDILILQ